MFQALVQSIQMSLATLRQICGLVAAHRLGLLTRIDDVAAIGTLRIVALVAIGFQARVDLIGYI